MSSQIITYRPLVAYLPRGQSTREANDCTVTALAVAGDLPYEDAYAFWLWMGREPGASTFVPERLSTRMRDYGRLGLRLRAAPFRPRSLTLKTFLSRYPKGRYFVLLANHAVAVVDGTAFDWNENIRRIVIGAWRVSDSPKNNAK